MARQSPNRPEADEPAADVAAGADATADAGTSSTTTSAAGSTAGSTVTGSSATDAGGRALWDETRISPVEIALPGGVGLTLRAYRLASELTPTEVDLTAEEDLFDARERAAAARAGDSDDEEVVILDEEYAALMADGDADPKDKRGVDGTDAEEPDPADFADDPAESATSDDEEVPAFLSHRGRLLLFKNAESLVSFIRSGAPHDLAQLDSWPTVAERVQTTDIAAQEDDSYELDLVVENLRGGHDTWDLPLLIQAGEIARDLGYALRLKPVIMALAAGSPLDDLDNSLRSAATGGMGGFFGKRRLRKIGAQQASLGWRSIIGKISAAVDWRD